MTTITLRELAAGRTLAPGELIELAAGHTIVCEDGPYSNSRVNRCDLNRKLRYKDKIRPVEPVKGPTELGSAMHLLLERGLRWRHEHGTWPEYEDICEGRLIANHITKTRECWELTKDVWEYKDFELVDTELRLGCDFFGNPCDYDAPECFYRGIIDAVYIDREQNAGFVVDHKMRPSIFTDDDLAYGKAYSQTMGYAYLVHKHLGIEYLFRQIYYPRFGVLQTAREKQMRTWIEQIIGAPECDAYFQDLRLQLIAVELLEVYEAQPSQEHCQYCEFQSMCDKVGSVGEFDVIILDEEDAVARLEELVSLDEYTKRLKSRLSDYAKAHGKIESESGPTFEYKLKTTTTIKHKELLKDVSKKKPRALEDLNVTAGTAEKLFKRHPEFDREDYVHDKQSTRLAYSPRRKTRSDEGT